MPRPPRPTPARRPVAGRPATAMAAAAARAAQAQSAGARRRRGFTLIELIAVLAIVALLAAIATPRYIQSVERAREATLRSSLRTMREAIDQYAADHGRYPDSLQALVEADYLRELPEDPISGKRDGWLQLAPAPDALLEGEMADVRSGAAGRGRDGQLYADW